MDKMKNAPKIIKNPDGSYMSPDQIAEHYYQGHIAPDKAEVDNWKRATREDVQTLGHFTLGMWIRNRYGLWQEDNPHVKLNPEPNKQGVIDDPKFPDQISGEILGKVWDKVQKPKPLSTSKEN